MHGPLRVVLPSLEPAMSLSSVSAADVRQRLQSRDPLALRAVLEAAQVSAPAGAPAEDLAERLVAALWWRTHTPAGQLVVPDSLDKLVDRMEARLRLDLGLGDAWQRLDRLAEVLVPRDRPISVDQLDDTARRRLRRPVWGRLAGTGMSASSFASGWAARKVLVWTAGPLWDFLLALPRVGSAVFWVRNGAGAVAAVSTPLGIGLALLTLNSALGPRYEQAVPLLVGISLVLRDPVAQRG